MTFNEWKAENAAEIEAVADLILCTNTEPYSIWYNNVYAYIERVCEMAFSSGRNSVCEKAI